MKHTLSSILIFFIALFLYTKLAGPLPFFVTSTTTTKTDSFTVEGTGKVTVIPDIAIVSVGVQTSGKTVKQAQDDLNVKINAVSESIKKIGIDNKDIQTTQYNVSPMYDYTNGKQTIIGYQASANLTVKIRKIEQAHTVIDAATAAGANSVSGISFDVDDTSTAQNEAREKAVAEAKKKAIDASKIAGFSLGKIINYQEIFKSDNQPRPMVAKAIAGMGENDTATDIETGSSDISVTVTLSYELR